MLITTGDLSKFDFGAFDLIKRDIPAFGVYGNHDDGCSYLEDFQIVNVHNKVAELKSLKIGGFQGCPRYNSREMQFTEQEAMNFAQNFPYVDVLLLHAGPKDMLDDPSDPVHMGSKFIKKYVIEKKPKYVFCGHQYTNDYLEQDETKIYRTYGARIIEVQGLIF
jgi:Icc-related predicted phosphoesterase